MGCADHNAPFRTIEDRPIFWTDSQGATHRCEGAEIHVGVRLLWTLCNKDVPANAAFLPGDDDKVTCRRCLAASRKHDGYLEGLTPPHVADADKPLRRSVAMAYRTGREAGWSHRQANEAAMAVYCAEHPGQERLAASARVSEMIASAVLVNPTWFWKTFRHRPISAARSRTERAMCNDYEQHVTWAAYCKMMQDLALGIPTQQSELDLPQADDIRINDLGPVMRAAGNGIELAQMRFGFPVGNPRGAPVFNYRSEGRRFRKSNRCLVPASAFFEFTGNKYPKAKHRFAPAGAPFLAIAGLWREGQGN